MATRHGSFTSMWTHTAFNTEVSSQQLIREISLIIDKLCVALKSWDFNHFSCFKRHFLDRSFVCHGNQLVTVLCHSQVPEVSVTNGNIMKNFLSITILMKYHTSHFWFQRKLETVWRPLVFCIAFGINFCIWGSWRTVRIIIASCGKM